MTGLFRKQNRRHHMQTGLVLAALVFPSIHSTLMAEEFPDPGVHWRTPVADERGEFLYAQGSDVVMRASIVDLALVSKVEFSVDGSLVGTATTPPYTYTWEASGSGVRTIAATAFAGNQSLSSVDQDIEVIGDVLVITPELADITLPSNGTTSLVLNIDNRTNIGRDWALQIQGGTAEIGNAGAIAETIQYDESRFGRSEILFRGKGTASTADDELWISPDNGARNDFRRFSINPWTELTKFDTGGNNDPRLDRGVTIDRLTDELIAIDVDTTNSILAQKLTRINVTTANEISSVTDPSYVPPLSLNGDGNTPLLIDQIAWAPGITYRLASIFDNPDATYSNYSNAWPRFGLSR